jgi:gliding motility-associated lipoprotein GldH
MKTRPFQKPIIIFFLLSFLFLSGCKKSIYDKIESFPRNIWKKEVPISFKADIQDNSKPVNIILLLRHGTHTQFNAINVNVLTVKPDGSKKNDFYGIEIRDKETGNLKGDAMGEMCDTELVIEKNVTLDKGIYTFTVSHEMEEALLPSMVDLGLKIQVVE